MSGTLSERDGARRLDRYRRLGWTISAAHRGRLPVLVLGFAALIAFALLLYLTRNQTFFYDAWIFIRERRDWTLDSFMAPHYSHWILTMALAWKSLLELVGLHSYMPYLALMFLLHVALAAGLYRVCSRLAGTVVGLAAAVRLLFFGYAHEVFFQAFNFNFVGAGAAGIWALALFLENASRRRLAVASGLLVAAVTTAGLGLFFIAAIGAVCVLSAPRRRDIWVVVPAIVAYGVWLAAFGRSSFDSVSGLSLVELVQFVATGVVATIGATAGSANVAVGGIGAAVIAVAVLWDLIRYRRIQHGVIAGLAGLLAEFVIIGLAREAQFGAGGAVHARYAYTGSVFLMVAAAAWLGPHLGRLREVGHERWRRIVLVGVACAALVVTVRDGYRLVPAAEYWKARSDAMRAVVSIFLAYGGEPAVPGDRRSPPITSTDDSYVVAIPAPDELKAIVSRYGSPLVDVLVPGRPDVPDDVYDRAMFTIVQPAIVVSPATRQAVPAQLTVIDTSGIALSNEGAGCLDVRPTAAGGWVEIGPVSGGNVLQLASVAGDDATVAISVRGTWQDNWIDVPLDAGVGTSVSLPDVGPQLEWLVRVEPSGTGPTQVCLRQRT